MARQLLVHLVGDSTKFSKSLDDAQKKSQSFGQKMDGFGKKMTTRVSLPLAGAGVAAFKMASDLNESLSATDARFGKSSKDIRNWAKDIDASFGLTQRDALDMVTQLRAVTQNSELTNDQMKTLAERAADVGSQFNMSAKEVGERFRSAMTGSTEVMEIFGVNIKQGSQGMEDYAKSIGKSVKELTEAEKQAGFYEVIMKQTSTTQGDAANTADTAAGKMRILKTDMADTAAEIGQKLMPAGDKLLGWLQSTMGWLDKIPGGSDTAIAAMLGFAVVGPAITGVTAAVKALTVAINLSKAAVLTHPFLVFAAALTVVYFASEDVRRTVDDLIDRLTSWTDTWKNLTRQVEDFIDMIKKIPSKIPGIGFIGDVTGALGKIRLPGFDTGGVVGGPRGAAQLAMVHGGETILPTHRTGSGVGGSVVVNINAGTVVHERDLPRVVMDAIRAAQLVGIT